MNNDNNVVNDAVDDNEPPNADEMPNKYTPPLFSLTDDDYTIPKTLKFKLLRAVYAHLKDGVPLAEFEDDGYDAEEAHNRALDTLRYHAYYFTPKHVEFALANSKNKIVLDWAKRYQAKIEESRYVGNLRAEGVSNARDMLQEACLQDIAVRKQEGNDDYRGKPSIRITKWMNANFGPPIVDDFGPRYNRMASYYNDGLNKSMPAITDLTLRAYRRAWWANGQFGQGASCWWNGYYMARYASEMSGRFLAMCLYRKTTDKGSPEMPGMARAGRFWLYQPTTRNYLLLMNGYGAVENQPAAKIISRMFELTTIRKLDGTNVTSHNIYTNGVPMVIAEEGVKVPENVPLYIYRPEPTAAWKAQMVGGKSPIITYLQGGRPAPLQGD